MGDLSNCGCGCGSSVFGGNNCIFLILILLFCCNGRSGCGCGCGSSWMGGNSCSTIIILLLYIFCDLLLYIQKMYYWQKIERKTQEGKILVQY